MAPSGPFAFTQFEFGFALGPDDGRYVVRPGGPGTEPERVIVVSTVGAPRSKSRLSRRRRPRRIERVEPASVPVARATVIAAQPFPGQAEAVAWLERVSASTELADAEVTDAIKRLNEALRAYRAAALDPYARDVTAGQALAVRLGYGDGDQVADGRFAGACEVPRDDRRRKRSEMLLPNERLAAVLGGREPVLAGEELVLRARADLDSGRTREAALQARVALEALAAEMGERAGSLAGHREKVAEAANAALEGELDESLAAALADAVDELERTLRRARGGVSG